MPDDRFEEIDIQEEVNVEENNSNSNIQNFLDNDLLLLIIILFIFFNNNDAFSEQFQFLNGHVKKFKNYLDTADATLQALDQATQIPNQMLE